MSRARVCLIAVCGLALTGSLAGCALVPPFVPPELPPEIQFVLDDLDTFTLPADLEADPNAPPIADASALTGCWARTFDPLEVDVTSADVGAALPGTTRTELLAVDLWRFDAAAQTVQYDLYVRDLPTGVILLQIMSGTFEVREPGLVAVRFQTFAMNDWTTGRVQSVPAPGADTSESFLRVQRNGDRLFLVSSADETDTAGTDKPWVFQRFDCP